MKKPVIITIVVVAVLAIIGATFAILYFNTDLFKGLKKPKAGFHEYLDKVTKIDDNSLSYEDVISKLKKAEDDSFETSTKLTMNVEVSGMLSQYQKFADVLNKTEFNLNTKGNVNTSESEIALNVKYDGEDLGTINSVINNEKIGIKFGEISDKYYTMDMKDLKNYGETIISSATTNTNLSSSSSLISIPGGNTVNLAQLKDLTDKISKMDPEELIELIDIKDSEITRILDRYKGVIKDTVDEKNYSASKEKITVNGKEMNTNAYTVKLTDKDLIKIAKNVLKSMKDDSDTLNIVVEKVNKFLELMDKTQKLSKSDLTQILESVLSGIDNVTEVTGKDIEITLYESGNEVVRIAIKAGEYGLTIDSVKDGDKTTSSVTVKINGEEMKLFTVEETKKGDDNYTIKISTDIQGVKLEVTLEVNGDKLNTIIYVEVQGIIKATLNINSEISYKSVDISKLTSSNSVAIKSLTSANSQELTLNAVKYLSNKIDTIEKIAKALGYEDEIKQFTTQLKSFNTSSLQTTTTKTTTPTTEPTAATTDDVAA